MRFNRPPTIRQCAGCFLLLAIAIGLLFALESDAQEIPRYDRSAFPHWQTRQCRPANHAAMARWATGPLTWRSERECRITAGTWYGAYGGDTYTNPRQLDTDHVVPLSWAWRAGAWEWDRDRRREFANDPANLIPVSLRLNRQKGDKGPSEWMPPRDAFACEYVLRFNFVLVKYGLPASPELAGIISTECFKETP